MGTDSRIEYPPVLADLADLLARPLQACMDDDAARAVAKEQAEEVRRWWGGSLIYIPQGARYDRQQRDEAILQEFDGRNHAALARKHHLSLSCVYDIVARARR